MSVTERRTRLGRRLDSIRQRIKASGDPLLSWEEIDEYLVELRGQSNGPAGASDAPGPGPKEAPFEQHRC